MSSDEVLDVVIVGAGISGLGMAAHLAMACPSKSYAVIERRAALGGTWDLFRYPGIRSDSDMFTLGYAFAPWREDRAIAEGGAIRAYLHRVAAEHGIDRHIRHDRTVTGADWDSAAGVWRLDIAGPQGSERLCARFLYLGTGYYDYDTPHDPAIPGLGAFTGQVIHPQFWPENLDWTDKRVVVIGSGATAVTIVPAMAEAAGHITMLQRTPSWYKAMPARDRIANLLRRLLPEKASYKLIRARNRMLHSFFFRQARKRPGTIAWILQRETRRALGPAYRAQDFTPPYAPWEQRLCLVPDGDLFAAIRAGKASIVTGQIAAVEPGGIRLADGRQIPADVIVTATGLRLATLGKIALALDGVPVKVADHFWYRDCMLSNIPNLAVMFGYLNAPWTLRVDIVAAWLCRLLEHMDRRGMGVATPVLPPDHGLAECQPFDMFSSGYLQRGRHLIPKSATTAPWRIHMDYAADRRELAQAPIDDGWLQFSAPLPAPGKLPGRLAERPAAA